MSDTRFRATIIHKSPVIVVVRFATRADVVTRLDDDGWRSNGALGFMPREWEAFRQKLEAAGIEVVGDEGVAK